MHIGPLLRAMLRNKVRFGLLAFEVALTLAIVANCVSLILDARQQLTRPSGMVDTDLVTVSVSPFTADFREDTFRDQVIEADLAALRAMPGVANATSTRFLPWQGGGSSTQFQRTPDSQQLRTQIYTADAALLDTTGLQLVEGRMFTRDDVLSGTALARASSARAAAAEAAAAAAAAPAAPGPPQAAAPATPAPAGPTTAAPDAPPPSVDVVISRAYARLMFPEGEPLGKTFPSGSGPLLRVIGVIGEFYNPYAWNIGEYVVFRPFRDGSYERGFAYLIRAEPGERDRVAAAVEQTLVGVDPGRTFRVRTIEDVKAIYQGPQTLLVRLLSLVIVSIVFITSLGIVGLTSFSVAERTRQIGTRRALGAARGDILKHFLMENWVTTSVGVALGVVLAMALNAALLNAVDSARLTPLLVVAGAAVLWIAGLVATLWPAWRGAHVPPAEATRNV